MIIQSTTVAVACDGTKFYDENKIDLCTSYENDLITKIETEINNTVSIVNIDKLRNGISGCTYVLFNDKDGFDLFIKYLKYLNHIDSGTTITFPNLYNEWFIVEFIKDDNMYRNKELVFTLLNDKLSRILKTAYETGFIDNFKIKE